MTLCILGSVFPNNPISPVFCISVVHTPSVVYFHEPVILQLNNSKCPISPSELQYVPWVIQILWSKDHVFALHSSGSTFSGLFYMSLCHFPIAVTRIIPYAQVPMFAHWRQMCYQASVFSQEATFPLFQVYHIPPYCLLCSYPIAPSFCLPSVRKSSQKQYCFQVIILQDSMFISLF